jgi:DNA-binding transcriptional LysR family regulator
MIYNRLLFFLTHKMLKLQQLRQFVIAAASGSFKVAATTTFRSQAAVSIAMRELEKTIGGHLLERDRRGKFTPLGEALLPLFQELLTVHDRVLSQSRQLAQGEQGSISVAVAPFLAEQWMPDLIAGFAELHPGIRIRAIEERSSKIRGLVADGTATIGVAGLLADDSKLNIRAVAIDSYGVLCSLEHPFARKRTTTWNSLRGEKLIGSDAFEVLTAAGLTARLGPPHLIVTSRAPLLACVSKNLGITILPMLTRPGPNEGFAFVPLTHPKLSRTVAIITRGTESLLPAGQRLEEMLVESLRDFALKRGAKRADAQRG